MNGVLNGEARLNDARSMTPEERTKVETALSTKVKKLGMDKFFNS